MDSFDDILSGIYLDEEDKDHAARNDEGQDPDENYVDEEDEDFTYNHEEDAKAEEDLLKGLEAETGETSDKKAKTRNSDLFLDGYNDVDDDDDEDDGDDDDDEDYYEEDENEVGKAEKSERNHEEEEDKDLNPLVWSFTRKDLTGNPRDVLDQNMALQEVIRCEINKLRARISQNMKMQRNLTKVLKQGNKIKTTGKHRGFTFFPTFCKDVNHIHILDIFSVIHFSFPSLPTRNQRRTMT